MRAQDAQRPSTEEAAEILPRSGSRMSTATSERSERSTEYGHQRAQRADYRARYVILPRVRS